MIFGPLHPETLIPTCLNLGFVAVKRHHDQGNTYKGKHLIGAGLQVQKFSPLLSGQETWQCADRHGPGGATRVLHLDP